MNKEIKGKNIILREQRPEDAKFFAYWFNQPQIMFQCGFTEPTDEEKERTSITVRHKTDDSVWFTITDPAGNIIGETGLLRMFPAWHQTDLSIIIPDPKMQHKGYGTEAIRIMLDLAFNEYEMHRVAIGVVGLNSDALKFYTKIGFIQEGIQEQGYFYNNEYSDFIMMRILRHEWTQKKKREKPMTELRPITEDNFIDAFNLRLGPGQEKFVSHPIRSLAQAYVCRDQCQPFGIYAGEKMVGYVMVIYDYDVPEYDIWHMMIDESEQGRGYGSEALDEVISYIRKKPFGDSDRVALTCSRSNSAARKLYEKKGFSATGIEDEDEIEMVLMLSR